MTEIQSIAAPARTVNAASSAIKSENPKLVRPKAISLLAEKRIPNGKMTAAQVLAWYEAFEQQHGCTPEERVAQLEAEYAQLVGGGAA